MTTDSNNGLPPILDIPHDQAARMKQLSDMIAAQQALSDTDAPTGDAGRDAMSELANQV